MPSGPRAWRRTPRASAHSRACRSAPHYGASKIRWCLEHLPAVARAADAGELLAAPLASYLALQLGAARPGAARVDAANASRTLLFRLAATRLVG